MQGLPVVAKPHGYCGVAQNHAAAVRVGRLGGRLNQKRGRVHCAEQTVVSQKSLEPTMEEASAFAPATIANLGPGFDWLGCAVEGDGDIVHARAVPGEAGEIVIKSIEGDDGRLSKSASKNCVGIAAAEAIRLMGGISCSIELSLQKGLPLGSGMGSSAASAAAGACAVNLLFGAPLSDQELVLAGLQSEAVVSGYHADNIAPAIMGGFILISSTKPLDLQKLAFPGNLWFSLVTPDFEAPTSEMRAVLPEEVPMSDMIHNCSKGGELVAGILQGDVKLLGSALNADKIVEPVRGPLIPGFQAAKEAALNAGAFGCTIGGAGPTTVAIVASKEEGEKVCEAMSKAYMDLGGLATKKSQVVQLDSAGARQS